MVEFLLLCAMCTFYIISDIYRTELSGKIMSSSGKPLKKPTNVVRPAQLEKESDDESKPYCRRKSIILPLMKYMDLQTLSRALSVCKDWNTIGMSAELWDRLDLTHR